MATVKENVLELAKKIKLVAFDVDGVMTDGSVTYDENGIQYKTFNVKDGKLNGILNQRSNDMLVANNWNVCQYSILIIMLAQVCGFKPGELVHVISDAHLYDRHLPILEKVMSNPQYDAPILKVNPDVKDFYDFKVEDFELVDYKCTPLDTKLEVAV